MKNKKKTIKEGWNVEEVAEALKKAYKEAGWDDSWGVRVIYLRTLVPWIREALALPPKKHQ